MRIDKQKYLHWQNRLKHDAKFRLFWQICSNYVWLALLPVLWYIIFYRPDARTATALILAFVLVRLIFIPIIVFFFPKPRPYQEFGFEPITSRLLSLKTESPNSFPSRHVASMAAGAGVLAMGNPVLALVFFIVAFITALGRIVLGYHYPIDVVTGLIFGLVVGVLFSFLI